MEKKNKKDSKKKTNTKNTDDTIVYKGKKKKKKAHPKLKLFLKIFIILVVVLCLIGGGIVAGVFMGLFGDEFKINKQDLVVSATNSSIVDRDGNIIGSLAGDEIRQTVTLSEMPKYLPIAYVSIEDERFYEHHGVDIWRTGKAVATYVFNRGESSFGGSTITQQLVKNITKDKEDSGMAGVIRKVKEMAKAYQIEELISKDQILELYLNILFVGGPGNHGVQMGAKYYFDKDVADLTLEECAFLAGINHSPNSYNPFQEKNHDKIMENIKKRTKTVLAKMYELGKISQEEKESAVAKVDEGLNFSKGKTVQNSYSYHTEAAINAVVKDFAEKNGWDTTFAKMKLQSGGYTIHTTQNTGIQNRMEQEFAKSSYIKYSKSIKLKDAEGNETDEYQHTQAAMAVIDYKTGQVLGTVGGLGDKTNGDLNRATSSVRQPGSATKPISTIAPAIEEKIITAGTVYDDSKTVFGSYTPKNDGNKYLGLITVRDAIAASQNMIPLKIMTELKPGKSIDYMRKMGITTLYKHGENSKKDDESLPVAIGGLSDGISPLEMAAAYGTIANDGEYITPIFYTSVTDSNGNVVLEPTQEKRRVISAEAAYVTKSILTQPVLSGTATYCAISGMDVAAKTGTTNGSKDRWLCGFTPYYAAATWFGYDQPEEVVWSGRNPSGQIWSNIIKDIHSGLDKKKFERPTDIVNANICRDSGNLAGDQCKRTYSEVFIKGTEPTKTCEGHISLNICADTGKIANEECPNKEERFYTAKPEKEETGNWSTDYGGKFDIPTEICTEHVKKEEPATDNKNDKDNKKDDKNDKNNDKDKNVINNTVTSGNTVNSNNTIDSTNTVNGGNTTKNENVVDNDKDSTKKET